MVGSGAEAGRSPAAMPRSGVTDRPSLRLRTSPSLQRYRTGSSSEVDQIHRLREEAESPLRHVVRTRSGLRRQTLRSESQDQAGLPRPMMNVFLTPTSASELLAFSMVHLG